MHDQGRQNPPLRLPMVRLGEPDHATLWAGMTRTPLIRTAASLVLTACMLACAASRGRSVGENSAIARPNEAVRVDGRTLSVTAACGHLPRDVVSQ